MNVGKAHEAVALQPGIAGVLPGVVRTVAAAAASLPSPRRGS